MIELKRNEIERVASFLGEAGLSESLAESMLDHLCCEIEDAMAEGGGSFEKAFTTVCARWPKKRLLQIDRKIKFTTKTRPMLIRLSSFAAIAAAFFLLSPFNNSHQSIADDDMVFREPGVMDPEVELSLLEPAPEPPSASPLAGRKLNDFHSGFGMRVHPIHKKRILHRGVDFRAEMGTPVHATADGKVSFAGRAGKNGIMVVIQHQGGYSTRYSHLQTHLVEIGESIELGEMIGAVGTTGASTGPHLHYELRKDDQPINPIAMLE